MSLLSESVCETVQESKTIAAERVPAKMTVARKAKPIVLDMCIET